MHLSASATTRWHTASFGVLADTLPRELADLGAHLSLCQRSSSRLVGLQCFGGAMHRFAYAHVATTLTVVALLVSLAISLAMS